MLACRNPLGSVDGVSNSRANSAYEFCNQGTGKHYKASTLPLPKEHASNEQHDKIQLTHYRIIEQLGAQRARHRRGGWGVHSWSLFFSFCCPAFSLCCFPPPLC